MLEGRVYWEEDQQRNQLIQIDLNQFLLIGQTWFLLNSKTQFLLVSQTQFLLVSQTQFLLDNSLRLEKAKDRGIVDSGCSRSMSGNKDKLEDFEDFDGGEAHRVLFTENECLVLSKDFPLPDPSMVILSIPRKHNLYTFSLNKLALKDPLTYLIAKASHNESTLWHRRLSHVNFRNMNKLVKGNLVRGLTPQQNGVAERKNQTLIEAARTMLADSLLPTMFWSEAIATACNVLNRVLVTMPHHKTPYELLTRDKPSISYLKPFGCHVTILNTNDSLGKFDKKSNECYIVGYSISSKAYRVYNLVSRKIEETMNLKFLENKSFVAGTGQAWMFDIDYLTDSLNHSRVSSNNLTVSSQGATPFNAGSQEDDSDSDDESDVLIIQSTPTQVVPIVDEATTQNDGKEVADHLGLAFLSLNLILGVGTTSIGSSVSASSTPQMSPCASPISADRHSSAAGKSPVSTGRPTGSTGRLVFAGNPTGSAGRHVSDGRPSGSAARTSIPIFDCPKFGIFTSSSYDEEFFGPDANNLASSVDEPTTMAQALADPDWVEAMQAEMQQFENQKVWVLVTLPNGKRAIRTKWILKNKRDARGKFVETRLNNSKLASTPFESQKIREKNVPDEPINVYLYRFMIGCLMYLTTTRPDIMFAPILSEAYGTHEILHLIWKLPLTVIMLVRMETGNPQLVDVSFLGEGTMDSEPIARLWV
nr:putative ribonuclease H-like domain-containing protein [Tanacetum cinerariifolium]